MTTGSLACVWWPLVCDVMAQLLAVCDMEPMYDMAKMSILCDGNVLYCDIQSNIQCAIS